MKAAPPRAPERIRHVRAPVPILFPSEESVPESKRHIELRTLLYLILKLRYGAENAIGCDQFVYWNAREPRRCLSPDAFVRLGQKDDLFPSWKTWERGTPEVGVEILSGGANLPERLVAYHEAGFSEVVVFDPEGGGVLLRVWDRIEGDLVERELGGARVAEARHLGAYWVVAEDPSLGPALRLATDPLGEHLLPTPAEAVEAERDAAAARIRELEAELARRGG